MKFHLVIPARYESTRLPRKLLLDKTGKPLIAHTIENALAIIAAAPEVFSGLTIAVDNEELFKTTEDTIRNNRDIANCVMTRVDHTSGTDRIAEAVEKAGLAGEVVINIQGDEPEIPPSIVIDFAKYISSLTDFTMATLTYPLETERQICDPNLVKVVCDTASNALYFSRSPIPYNRNVANGTPASALGHIGIYAYTTDVLKRFISLERGNLESLESLEQLRALENGINISVFQLSEQLPKGIDTLDDYNDFLKRV